MITTKEYDLAINQAKDKLDQAIYDETLDYEETCKLVQDTCITLLLITLRFQGQEEL